MCMAILTSFPGCPPDRWSHEACGVEKLEDWTEDETQDYVAFGDDAELEGAKLFEVLLTWRQTRTAMAQEKLSRGLRMPVRQHSKSTPIVKNAPKPDLARLAGRTRCYNCREVGSEHQEMTLACDLCHAIWNCQRLPTSSQPTNHIRRN